MATYHYNMLRIQTPRNSIVYNNLSVLYDEVGAVATKIALLREAQGRKDSGYVSANLARAYAKAGFLADARESLKHVPEHEQQEPIVQGAYRTITEENKANDDVTEKLDRLIKTQRGLIEKTALTQVNKADEDLLQQFLGEWQLEEESVLKIWVDHTEVMSEMVVANKYYEFATYKIRVRYQPGLLELDLTLDESSLKPRPQSKEVEGAGGGILGGFGSLGNALYTPTLLSRVMHRPDERVYLLLMPGESGSLSGIKATSSTSEEQPKQAQLMLNAKEVRLTRRER